MMKGSQKNSKNQQNQQNILKKIYHDKCGNYLDHKQIIELIGEYLQVKTTILSLSVGNINIDDNLTKKCCSDLKISSVLDRIKKYCLKCQRQISQFAQNQHKQYLNEIISFCSQCFLDIQRTKTIDQSNKTSIEHLLESIVMYCKAQSNNEEDKGNQQYQQQKQPFQLINEKELIKYSPNEKNQNEKLNDLKKQLSKMTKSQLIDKILAMTLETEKLQQQNKFLKSQSEFSLHQSNLITLLNTSKNSSRVESSFNKDQSGIQNVNQNFSKEKSDDQHTLFHPQKIEQAQKIKQYNQINASSNLQNVIEQKSEDDMSSNGKPITRSQRKPNYINVLSQNQCNIHLNMTTPVKGPTKKQSSKDSAETGHVNVPIWKKNVSNNN